MLASLKCSNCQKSINIEIPSPSLIALELSQQVIDAGWIAHFGLERERLLAFCSVKCRCKALARSKRFKVRHACPVFI